MPVHRSSALDRARNAHGDCGETVPGSSAYRLLTGSISPRRRQESRPHRTQSAWCGAPRFRTMVSGWPRPPVPADLPRRRQQVRTRTGAIASLPPKTNQSRPVSTSVRSTPKEVQSHRTQHQGLPRSAHPRSFAHRLPWLPPFGTRGLWCWRYLPFSFGIRRMGTSVGWLGGSLAEPEGYFSYESVALTHGLGTEERKSTSGSCPQPPASAEEDP